MISDFWTYPEHMRAYGVLGTTLAAIVLTSSAAAAVPSGDDQRRWCEWDASTMSTGFTKYDRLLASNSTQFWRDGSPVLVSIPLGVGADGHWREKVVWVCPSANYDPPGPATSPPAVPRW